MAILLAVIRVLALLATTVLALSRLDKCIFTIAKQSDNGYKSFLAMTLMLHAVKLQTAHDDSAGSIHSMPGQKVFSVESVAAKGGDRGAGTKATREVQMDRVYDGVARTANRCGAGKWKLVRKNMDRPPEAVDG